MWHYFETGAGNSEEPKKFCTWFDLIVFCRLFSRWIIWTKTVSALWFTLLSEDTWRWWSSWSNATGPWLGNSREYLRRATPSSRRWSRRPAWVTPRWDVPAHHCLRGVGNQGSTLFSSQNIDQRGSWRWSQYLCPTLPPLPIPGCGVQRSLGKPWGLGRHPREEE